MAECVPGMVDVDVLLRSCECQQWFTALYYHGVRRVQDIMELHDNDLACMGMDTVSMRKLQRALYEYSLSASGQRLKSLVLLSLTLPQPPVLLLSALANMEACVMHQERRRWRALIS